MFREHVESQGSVLLDESRKPLAVILGALSVRISSDLSAELAADILSALKVEGMAIYRADGMA
jgi:hypothetical protein